MTMGLIAGIAVNLWLFRLGVFWGIVGLSISKHVLIAYLCEAVGVDRNARKPARALAIPVAPQSVPSSATPPVSAIGREPATLEVDPST